MNEGLVHSIKYMREQGVGIRKIATEDCNRTQRFDYGICVEIVVAVIVFAFATEIQSVSTDLRDSLVYTKLGVVGKFETNQIDLKVMEGSFLSTTRCREKPKAVSDKCGWFY